MHGYLTLSGTLLPRAAAVSCLWDRVFTTGDARAHERLSDLLGGQVDADSGRSAYTTSLETEWLQRLASTRTVRRRDLERWVQNLRQGNSARVLHWELIVAPEPRLRELGRQLLLPDVGQALASPDTPPGEVHRWIEKLCPNEDVWCKIGVCQRLFHHGASAAAVKECLRALQGQRPVSCPECSAPVPQAELESHMQAVHHVERPGNTLGPPGRTVDTLLTAVCRPEPDHDAWTTLETLAGEEYGEKVDGFLASRLTLTLGTLPEATRREAVAAAAELAAASVHGTAVALRLARSSERVARQLALALASRLQPPLNPELVRALRPLLAHKRARLQVQLPAAAALLRTTGVEGRAAAKVLNALISRCSKPRALDRLRQLQQLTGELPVITDRRLYIESRIRMTCTRCPVQLPRPALAQHLWTEHGLLLDGRRVREPWRLVEDWLEQYGRSGSADLLIRSRTLGQYLDPARGLRRVHRLLLSLGVKDVEATQVLTAEARQRQVCLCPHCYAFVPLPEVEFLKPLNQSHGRLSLGGYCVEVSERGLVPRLRIETPGNRLYDGREPQHGLTRRGASLLLAGPWAAAALLLALLLPQWEVSPQWPVVAAVALAAAVYLGVCLAWWRRPPALERALVYAWTWLAPRLHTGSFSRDDAVFLAGLALSSKGVGQVEARSAMLDRFIRITENAVVGRQAPLDLLLPLRRLALSDAARRGHDPGAELTAAMGRCLAGDLPLDFVEQLAAGWEGSPGTAGAQARLRALLCDRAFEAGREVRDLMTAGILAPTLGQFLQIQRADELCQLRLLWSLRPSRPWDRWGKAVTAFELAGDPEGPLYFQEHPDLLLLDRTAPEVIVCGRGVVFNGSLFTQRPHRVEMKARRDFDSTSYEIVVDDLRWSWPGDAATVVRRLDRWFHFFFTEFAPRLNDVRTWHAPAGTKPLRTKDAAPCPECGRWLITRCGEVGATLDDRQAAPR
jgi:hypothetical protein